MRRNRHALSASLSITRAYDRQSQRRNNLRSLDHRPPVAEPMTAYRPRRSQEPCDIMGDIAACPHAAANTDRRLLTTCLTYLTSCRLFLIFCQYRLIRRPFVDLSFQEKSSWCTLTIIAFECGYCCPHPFGMFVRDVVKCTLPPNHYRRGL